MVHLDVGRESEGSSARAARPRSQVARSHARTVAVIELVAIGAQCAINQSSPLPNLSRHHHACYPSDCQEAIDQLI